MATSGSAAVRANKPAQVIDYGDLPFGGKFPQPITDPSEIDLGDGDNPVSQENGAVKIENADGSVTISFGPNPFSTDDNEASNDDSFDANLAIQMDDRDLSAISSDILEGIQADEESRKDMLDMRVKGISLLGLKLEEPKADAGNSSAPVEGQSKVRHPLLLEACTSFQAGARAELLPAKGPVKVRSDAVPGAPLANPGEPNQAEGTAPVDQLAEALELSLNHYLTAIATEYVPDSDRMFFTVGFSGDGFKKGFHCPLRQRPVIESVDPEDLIVSNMATTLQNCGRVTHRIKMRRSVLRRMQLIGAYRDVDLQQPAPDQPNVVTEKIADVGGYNATPKRYQDTEYVLYEAYVELDLDEFAPAKLKGKALPLPYRVTIEKDSRKILEICRDWRETDIMCERRRTFVQYPFIRALGFYGLGFLHLLGNSALALTAAQREMLDNGMFANFPGFVYNKLIGRQLTNQFRCPPGGGIALDLPPNVRIQDAIMPIPYKETGPAFPAFIQHLEQNARNLAMVGNAPVAEGKQDAPVGTTLALIEQATKVLGSAYLRLHGAQAEEFAMLRDLFREDPEAMWRHAKGKIPPWTKQQFLDALNRYELVPTADPNNPTSLHRMAKGALIKTLQASNPAIYDPIAVDRRVMGLSGIDPEGLFRPPQPQGTDPAQMVAMAMLQIKQLELSIKQADLQLRGLIAVQEQQGKEADRSSRERIEVLKAQIQQWQTEEDNIIQRLKQNGEMIKHVHGVMEGQRAERAGMVNQNVQAAQQADQQTENANAPPNAKAK